MPLTKLAYGLLGVEAVLCCLIVYKVAYTEIDWIAYMQEVGGFMSGQFDYSQLRGDTGPLVYPAGFVYLFSILSKLTDGGDNILLAQIIFLALYLCNLVLVFKIYPRSISSWALILLCLSRRVHSIFMLRLFNDCWATALLHLAIYLFISDSWYIGCVVFSLAVSIKMNILLFAPGLLVLLLLRFPRFKTIPLLSVCAVTQLILGAPFLSSYPMSYLLGSFNFGRQFMYVWSVNWKFVPEDIFLSKPFAIGLLCLHVFLLALFAWKRWFPLLGEFNGRHPSRDEILLIMFSSNMIGILCCRSLHYQFYVWYFYSLPYLAWKVDLPFSNLTNNVLRTIVLLSIEVVWNIYPANQYASTVLLVSHSALLLGLWLSVGSKQKQA